ncbi:hypothetical protein ACYTTR_07550, partial [Cobetia marina]
MGQTKEGEKEREKKVRNKREKKNRNGGVRVVCIPQASRQQDNARHCPRPAPDDSLGALYGVYSREPVIGSLSSSASRQQNAIRMPPS